MAIPPGEEESLRRLYGRRESKMLGETYAGLEFDSYLTGPSGCAVVLFIHDDIQPEQIDRAKVEAIQKRDVTGFTLKRIPKEWVEAETFQPSADPKGWIDAVRWIVQNKQCRRIMPETGELVPENKTGGMLMDLFSASTMVQVYDALNDTNKAKLNAMDLRRAHRISRRSASQCGPPTRLIIRHKAIRRRASRGCVVLPGVLV
jgi:hypothetical protein